MKKKKYIVSYNFGNRVIDYCVCHTFGEALDKKKECDIKKHTISRVRVVEGDKNEQND